MGITSIDGRITNSMIPNAKNNLQFSLQEKETGDLVSFSGFDENCCVGIVDIVDSTKISVSLDPVSLGKYYSIFLNSMSTIVRRFSGRVVKNLGDSILYLFSPSTKCNDSYGLVSCLECGLSMIDELVNINSVLAQSYLPPLSFRVSSDYGNVLLATSENTASEDIFGASVNICAKINGKANKNSLVIGGDLYLIAKKFSEYLFREIGWYDVGLPQRYPIYAVRKAWR